MRNERKHTGCVTRLLVLGAALLCLVEGRGDAAPSDAVPHWSFQPLTRPPVPGDGRAVRSGNPIDSFIRAELVRRGLKPSPEADRRTLIRRLYFDLTGLPPSPEEVEAFVKDGRRHAYEQLVERLLASPRHGERWARHWLDVVRFAETHGFEMNQPRPNAWPYRDYVIRAFNEDKPYDRFVLEQLAGDAFGVDEATGFLVAGPWDQVKSPDPVLTANQRADELHDMVSTTGSAFLGLTVGCARCHNHKFDPVPQTDYFAIKAALAGVQHGERALKMPDAGARQERLESARRRLAEVEAALEQFEPLANVRPADTNRLRAAVHPRRNVERFTPVAARRVRFTVNATTDAEPCLDELEVYATGGGSTNIALASSGTKARASSVYPNSDIHRLEHLNDGRHGNGRSWISNERGKGWVELEFAGTFTIERIVWGRDREEKFRDRLATDYRIEVAGEAGDWRLVASSLDRHPYQRDGKPPPPFASGHLSAGEQATAKALHDEKTELEARIRELAAQRLIYAGKFESPERVHRLHRGDPMQKREPVDPGVLTQIGWQLGRRGSDLGRIAGALTEDQRRRLALAQWIVDPQNPLTARVMVNRIWQYHFGEGLVGTPSDFGVNGARPSHPELLDWLASEFIARGWSVKAMHRLIVLSAAYRQAGTARPEAMAVDAGSRLLWRFPPRRLEAEAIRDAMLAVSGRLDLRMGGPGFSFFAPNDNYVRVYEPRTEFGPETFRRMVYGTVVRQRPDAVFGVFDCPDAGQIAPRRSRSTTPLQALNLLNSRFVLEQAEFFAERLKRESGADIREQVRRAFALAFNRAPSRPELTAAVQLAREQGLTVLCRALLNANEFVYLF